MNSELLTKHISHYLNEAKKSLDQYESEIKERENLIAYYQSFTTDRILQSTEEQFYEYVSKLWAMLVWGNKHYVVDKLIADNGFQALKKELAELVWGGSPISHRWDNFRTKVKGMGPAMISEILCKTHPRKYLLWNRRAYVGLRYLGVPNLPRYDYQLTGKLYNELCDVGQEIASALKKSDLTDTSLLAVDYFIWTELQVEANLSDIYKTKPEKSGGKDKPTTNKVPESIKAQDFIHNDVRDKLRDIGEWLGFKALIEQKVADGSKVDTVWESAIGNMGRVIYVFEVQTKGSIDSLILNLLKSLNNPAVQGVVAVSDKAQLATIEKHVKEVGGLNTKLRYWDYEEVLIAHENLSIVYESINRLRLVPEGF